MTVAGKLKRGMKAVKCTMIGTDYNEVQIASSN